MLTGTQKGIMSDAMLAVTNSDYHEASWTDYLLRQFDVSLAENVGVKLDTGAVRVYYVEIFAKGDYANSTDFMNFFTMARLVANKDRWDGYNLDERFKALSSTEQGPTILEAAAAKIGVTGAWDSFTSSLSGGVDKLMVFALLALAVVVIIVKKT